MEAMWECAKRELAIARQREIAAYLLRRDVFEVKVERTVKCPLIEVYRTDSGMMCEDQSTVARRMHKRSQV